MQLRKRPILRTTEFPQGTFIQTERGWFYVQTSAQRYRFSTKRVLDSWSPQRIVRATEADPAVARMRISAKMKFRNGSLLHSHADGKMYLVSSNVLRHIVNPDVLVSLNLKRSEAVSVSLDEINLHEKGEDLK